MGVGYSVWHLPDLWGVCAVPSATGHGITAKRIRMATCIALSVLFLGGCATTSKDSAAIGDADLSELPAEATDAKSKTKTKGAKSGYVDPMVALASEPTPEWSAAGAEQQAAVADGTAARSDMAALITQPTGIQAGRSSIFSTNPPQYGTEPGMEAEAQVPAAQATVASLVPQDLPTRGVNPAFASVFSAPPGSAMLEETVEQPVQVNPPEAEASSPAVEAEAEPSQVTTDVIPAEPVLAPGVKKKKGSVLRRLHRRDSAAETAASR